ncbi:MAG: hypothetical protein HOI95_01115 [Chromatiales bacterium]|nr:hypothetical protein [Chromatiales bacterium]
MAMRLGSIKFILPFIIVLTPALIIRGEPLDVVMTISACTVAVILMAAGFEGYLYYVGRVGVRTRVLLFAGAGGFLYPEPVSYGITAIATVIIYGFFVVKARGNSSAAAA